MNGYQSPQLSYGGAPIDAMAMNYGQIPATSYNVASPTTGATTGMASPAVAPVVMPTGAGSPMTGVASGVGTPVTPMTNAGGTGTGVAPVAGGQQNLGNNLLWNGTGENRTLNYDGMQMIAGGLQTIGNLYMAWQQNKLAKDSLQLQRDNYETNLANQTTSYNNSLEDRIRGRYTRSQQNDPAIQAQIDERSL